MLKRGKTKQDKKSQHLHKDSSFNIRDLVMRTPTSSSPKKSPELYTEEKQSKPIKQDVITKPSPATILEKKNEKLADIIQELDSFDVSTIQRRSDPRMKSLAGRINDIIAEIVDRDSDEYDDYVIYSLDTLPITIGGSWHPLPEVQEGYRKGIQLAVSKLTSLLAIQRKKSEAVVQEKPKRHVVNELSSNQVITGKEKVSLISLRGKIKSRETVFFDQIEPIKESKQTTLSTARRKVSQDNVFRPSKKENKEIQGLDRDQKSIQETPRDRKHLIATENHDEKIKTLEETPVLEEKQPTFDERERKTLHGEFDTEKNSLSSLVAKLNETVIIEPEYTEAYTDVSTGNDEKVLSLLENEYSASVLINKEPVETPFVEINGLESLKLGENEEVLVIDGDNVLSSEPNFMESLENESGKHTTIKSVEKNEHVDNIAGETRRISLEDLERKLREFDEEEVIEKEPQTYFEEGDAEEVLLIEDSNDLPEEVKKELDTVTCAVQACETQFTDEEELVINKDANPDRQLHEIAHQSAPEDTIIQEGMLIIEYNSGLPEDVLDELQEEQVNFVNVEEQSDGLETSRAEFESLDVSQEQSNTNRTMIIDLLSHATSFDCRDEHTIKQVLLEDFEEKLKDFCSSEPEQEFLIYTSEEMESHADRNLAVERTTEPELIESGLRATDDIQNSLESCIAAKALNVGRDLETKFLENVIEGKIPELPEAITCYECNEQDLKDRFLPARWDDLCCQEIVNELVENALFTEINKEVIDHNTAEEGAYNTFSDQILIKDIEGLTDHSSDRIVTLPVHVDCFEPTLEITIEEENFKLDSVEVYDFLPDRLPDSEIENLGELNINLEEVLPEGAVFVVTGDELINQMPEELQEHCEKAARELSEQITTTDISEYSPDDKEDLSANEQAQLIDESILCRIEETVLVEVNEVRDSVSLKAGVNEEISGTISETLNHQANNSSFDENLVNDSLMTGISNQITEIFETEELTSAEKRGSDLIGMGEVFNLADQDSFRYNSAFELVEKAHPSDFLENVPGLDEPLPLEVFEECIKDSECAASIESGVEEIRSKDNILLEALEEMLSNLEANTPEQSHIHSEPITTQHTYSGKDENVHIVESQMKPPQKAVLIKTTEEYSNPFAMAGTGKEKPQAKPLQADDLREQIGELRYRIDDLKTFDIDSIKQRFDPRVLALGDTVNNTLADIFGRNTPLYWQHALPSLDSLPVVVGGPKLSPEELRDAYRKRINDAVSKVNTTIGILEAKLGKLEDKGVKRKCSEPITTQHTYSGKDENVHIVESQMKPPQKAVLIKTTEEYSNPFAMAGTGKEKPQAKPLQADDLREQIGELRYRIDDLKTFDIDSIKQRFDPRVLALGDTVNNTLADIFGRNTPLYWQHALPSLDSLPVVVGGPKLSPEELRDAYRKRINDAVSKVNTTIGILEAKLGKLEDKNSGGQVLFFSPKAEKYHDIQSLR
ncbi:MAG: hypothetical protein AB7Y74_03790 [Syntrophorhabdus sp.]